MFLGAVSTIGNLVIENSNLRIELLCRDHCRDDGQRSEDRPRFHDDLGWLKFFKIEDFNLKEKQGEGVWENYLAYVMAMRRELWGQLYSHMDKLRVPVEVWYLRTNWSRQQTC
jgi:hypothetical protein